MRYISLIVILCLLSSCGSSKPLKSNCIEYHTYSYKQSIVTQNSELTDTDTVFVNEIRYTCLYSSLYTNKAMYDSYGKWNRIIISEDKKAVCIWENIKLLDSQKNYTVFASGSENSNQQYAAIMVFDEQNKDVLSPDTSESDAIAKEIGQLIKNLKTKNKYFYKDYWSIVNPEKWEIIKKKHPAYRKL